MLETTLFIILSALLLIYGSLISFSFAKVEMNHKHIVAISIITIVCGFLQLFFLVVLGEELVWKLYPIITHLPIILFICFYFKKRLLTAIVSCASAYLCCQPAKWCGILVFLITNNVVIELFTRILVIGLFYFLVIFKISPFISTLYSRDNRTVLIFGSIPIVYYLFDYTVNVYSDLLTVNSQIVTEFLTFFLCIVFLFFCVFYYKEFEQKMETQQHHDMIRLNIQQHEKELSTLKRVENELRIIRHDLRSFLNNLALCINQDDKENALKMIDSYTKRIDGTTIHHYCENSIINYVLNNYKAHCKALHIDFRTNIEIGENIPDETLLSFLLSNAIDNAINAQKELDIENRQIHLVMQEMNQKLLIQIKNPFKDTPIFDNGIPVNHNPNHGYGVQSICHITKQLGGHYHFAIEENKFIIRIII